MPGLPTIRFGELLTRGSGLLGLLVALFAASGAAGLIYESLWSRYLGLFVGHSAYAQIIVLVIYLGGMSLGAHLVARRARVIRRPLLWYSLCELAIGVCAWVFHPTFVNVTSFSYDRLFALVGGIGLVSLKWTIAALLVLPQSVLLGATFPLMSAGALRHAESARQGYVLAALYFANSAGAAIGVLLPGLWLLDAFSLAGTMKVAGAVNAAVAVIVLTLVYAVERRAAPAPGDPSISGDFPDSALGTSVFWAVAFGTAIASFVYEIAWLRMLSLVFGSSTHSFEIMLSAFVLGLALGSLWIRGRADTASDAIRTLGRIQIAMGLLAVATLPLYLQSFDWMAAVLATVSRTDGGYRVFVAIRYLIAIGIMLPATFCAGMTLPLITRVLLRSRGERAVGAVYAVNTLGSIVGVVLAGLILMPLLGVKLLLIFGAAIDIALGIWLLARAAGRRTPASERAATRWRLGAVALSAAAAVAAIALVARFDVARLASGVYRSGAAQHAGARFLFYEDGRTASVSVFQTTINGRVTLATNGKPDASIDNAWLSGASADSHSSPLSRDDATQMLLPLIALAHNPKAENMAVVGYGSGVSSHVLLGSPSARQVITVEIEPKIVAGARFFLPANRRVTEDARSTVVIEDARAYFAASRRKFDIVLSEPSNPWVSGTSGLFSKEFYEHVARQLADGGVLVQWLQLYELSDELVDSVLAALHSVFPAYEVFYTSHSDIVIVAGMRELPTPDWGIVEYPGIRSDLERLIQFGPEWFETLRLGGRVTLAPLISEVHRVNSDFNPVLELGAERARFDNKGATGYLTLTDGWFDVGAALSGRRLGFGWAPFPPTPEIKRASDLALGARLRLHRGLASGGVPAGDMRLREAVHRYAGVMRDLRSGRPPADWQLWMRDVLVVHEDLHGGTAGVADSTFFSALRQYEDAAAAPPAIRAAVDFLHGLSAWNWEEAAGAAKRLGGDGGTSSLIPHPMFQEGAATAFIMTRDTARARKVLERPVDSQRFRAAMLRAILRTLDARAQRRNS